MAYPGGEARASPSACRLVLVTDPPPNQFRTEGSEWIGSSSMMDDPWITPGQADLTTVGRVSDGLGARRFLTAPADTAQPRLVPIPRRDAASKSFYIPGFFSILIGTKILHIGSHRLVFLRYPPSGTLFVARLQCPFL